MLLRCGFLIVFLLLLIKFGPVIAQDATGQSFDSAKVDLSVLKGKIETNNFASKIFENGKIENAHFVDCDFDDSSFFNVTLQNSQIHNRSAISGITINNLTIRESVLGDLMFSNASIDTLIIEDCEVEKLIFQESTINHFLIKRTHSQNIVFRNCSKVNGLRFMGGSSKEWIERNSSLRDISFVSFQVDNMYFLGGHADMVDFSNIDMEKARVDLQGVMLSAPKFSLSFVRSVDFSTVDWPRGEFRLLQEIEADEKNDRLGFLSARTLYAVLASRIEGSSTRAFNNKLKYRMRVVERKGGNNGFVKIFSTLWHEHFRGRYGTSPGRVMITFLFVWVFFSTWFFILGFLKIAWGVFFATKLDGHIVNRPVVKVITWRQSTSLISYTVECFAFSLDQLLSVGSRAFQVANLAEGMRFVPRRYVPVGVGRIFAVVENIVGLLLLVFLVKAFLIAGIS